MTMRRRNTVLVTLLLVVLAGCSAGDDGGSGTDGSPTNDRATGDVGTITELDENFDVGSLPDDFPDDLVPDEFTAGMYATLGTVRNANFETSRSFDEVVAEYSDKIGEEPIIAEAEERLASWLVDTWVVSVIEAEPTIIGVATTE